MSRRASSAAIPSGSSSVATSQRGRAPVVTRSFSLTASRSRASSGAAEGDRVRGRDQELVAANVQHGGVLSDGAAEDHVGRRGGQAAQKLSEQIGRELAGR